MNEETKNYLKEIGKRGGQATKKKHGKKHYQEIGKKGGSKPKKKNK